MKLASTIHRLFLFAALWGVVSGVSIFLYGGGTSVTATAINGESSQPIVRQVSWFESQGWWGVFILVVFAALYYGPLHFYQRGGKWLAVVFGLVAIVMTILAGFSIGPFYLLGAFSLLIALVLLPLESKRLARTDKSPGRGKQKRR